MSLVERWWLTDYATEIYVYLRSRERQRLNYRCQSPQLHLRRDLLRIIEHACEKLSLCILVQHLSVHLLDFFMDCHDVGRDQLQLMTLGCVIVAAKAEEKDALIPKNSDVSKLLDNGYDLKDLAKMELTLLTFFKWEVHYPTVAHFLDYFAIFAIFPNDYAKHADSAGQLEYLQTHMRSYLSYFLDASLKDHSFMQMPASMVAASCIVCSRACLLLNPLWSSTLESISNYKLDQLVTCINHLFTTLSEEGRVIRQDTKHAAIPGSNTA
ncbi:cyclin-J-like isoform X2 [Ornithodoros turicata]|uniref:cyclin-J-like isoform X2 n=1 Tax=Ornithodoros turicata TaxID=34597 RepID=UPI003138ED05